MRSRSIYIGTGIFLGRLDLGCLEVDYLNVNVVEFLEKKVQDKVAKCIFDI